ncbi:MAG: pantoate--beta-alanine ligase [Prevotella sp.]|jgi:pantoate--beta-alanine ligase|uniref:pantoate--beta-alanine ligase n=1 Tax=unclassified Dysgonomonas TaxID=2630389 RepID=UPI0025C5C75D|nr:MULTISPECIES: pantoate--beta-alanine ligase [unclassified Dysgonomonas]MDR1717634.1 pantoate--beta-alanine ligase [Prevotella sp.]MDR2003665.1 pantoate--beta-alanine ligase [Prevotella sp.]HMM01595.1 pantoate--beta-alanine ligase [Dysgonomonas sp.]
MDLIKTTQGVRNKVTALRSEGKTIGLVPTMGALHEGHLSLVKKCIADNDVCIVSIFVNPTQFNNKEDLKKYPRNLERDCEYLKSVGVGVIFAPSVDEVYPEPDTRQFDFGQLDKVMEGEHRPGHFNGVAQVVSRLFDIVKPDRAYFGEKDFQQLAIIREMVKQLKLDINIVPMPIVREVSGLALSSRNERLTATQKEVAVNISKVLAESKEWMKTSSVEEVIKAVTTTLDSFTELKVEYYEIVDGYTLQSVADWKDSDYIVGCIAIFCGEVRLIDNIIYKADSQN